MRRLNRVLVLACLTAAWFGQGLTTASAQPPEKGKHKGGDVKAADEGGEYIEFDSPRWVLRDAAVTEHLDRSSLSGSAYLKDTKFENGVIEFDVAASGATSYPGVTFRVQSPQEYERLYIRPHRSGLYPDVLQYVSTFNGVDSWQLYSGNGCTALATIPRDEWLHVRLEVMGTQARVFLGESDQPALLIYDLRHGKSKGTIGLMGPKDGSAYFSRFRYRADDTLHFDPPPTVDAPPGMIAEWDLSAPFKAGRFEADKAPAPDQLAELKWRKVTGTPSGLVDVSRWFGRTGPEPDAVFAKAVINAERDEVRKFRFGYSDAVTIYLNGVPLYRGVSTYRSRDPSFLGIVGLFDAVYLPLKKGPNELLVMVTETFGGWGFMFQDATAIFATASLQKKWETAKEFAVPESAAYDAESNVFFVSNYDPYGGGPGAGQQFISRVSADGKIESLRWATGLRNPAGVAIFKDRLFVAEPTSLVEIDKASGEIKERHDAPGAVALNDVAIDPEGMVYVSDSAAGVVFKFADGKWKKWLKGAEINRPNGLCLDHQRLLIGNNGDNWLKSADLKTKKISRIANLGAGIIDGIAMDESGNILVSHNEGRLYRVSPSGEVTKLLDTSLAGIHIADFTYDSAHRRLVFPTWLDHRLMAYELAKS